MSDVSQGPDWWLGADGKWYPPVAASSPNQPPAPPPTPGQAVPGQGVPGQAPPPPQTIIVQEKSKATPVLLGCLIALVAVPVLAVLAIAAVTLLGKSASSKFTSVAKAVSVIEVPAPGATAPPR